MKSAINIFSTHRTAIIVYICYALFSVLILFSGWRHTHTAYLDRGSKLVIGEGIIYGYLYLTLIGIVLTLITLFKLAVSRKGRLFYLLLLIGIITPLVILFTI